VVQDWLRHCFRYTTPFVGTENNCLEQRSSPFESVVTVLTILDHNSCRPQIYVHFILWCNTLFICIKIMVYCFHYIRIMTVSHITKAWFSHRIVPGQTFKQFTSTSCLHFRRELHVVTNYWSKWGEVQSEWLYKGFYGQSQQKWPALSGN
jgi:hypothetical protein